MGKRMLVKTAPATTTMMVPMMESILMTTTTIFSTLTKLVESLEPTDTTMTMMEFGIFPTLMTTTTA